MYSVCKQIHSYKELNRYLINMYHYHDYIACLFMSSYLILGSYGNSYVYLRGILAAVRGYYTWQNANLKMQQMEGGKCVKRSSPHAP